MSDPDWNMSEVEEENVAMNKKTCRKTSPVWNYCDIMDNGSYAVCRICHHKLSYKSSVTNLRKHFKRKHPEVSVSSNMQFLKNRPIRIRQEDLSSGDEERTEVQRATNSVIVDYLRPAGEESHPRISNAMNSFSKYAHTLKRERSPTRFNCIVAAKQSQELKSSKLEETELELFGRSVVMQLKTLPLVHALEVQAEITNLILQKRIQALKHREAPMQYALVYAAPQSQECHEEVTLVTSKEACHTAKESH